MAEVPANGKLQNAIDIVSDVANAGLGLSQISTGSVDTNRNLAAPGNPNETDAKAIAGRFTILDFGGTTNTTAGPLNGTESPDGNADFVVLTQAPTGFMVSIEGHGNGTGTIVSGVGDNAGTYFGTLGFQIGTEQVNIKAANLDGTGNFQNVAVLDYDQMTFGGAYYGIVELTPQDGGTKTNPNPNYNVANPGATRIGTVVSLFNGPQDQTVNAFDIYTPDNASTPSPLVAIPDTTPINGLVHALEIPDYIISTKLLTGFGGLDTIPEIENFFAITAGNGGNGLVGAGGSGGSLGSVLKTVTTPAANGVAATTVLLGALSITLPTDVTFNGFVTLDFRATGATASTPWWKRRKRDWHDRGLREPSATGTGTTAALVPRIRPFWNRYRFLQAMGAWGSRARVEMAAV